jgi:tetratricopeptide (TPR) repeat protein
METIDFSYFIERFNACEMSETEKEWFLKELETNEKLRNEVELRKHADEILKKHDVMSLRNKLSEIERQRREAKVPEKTSKRPVYVRYAAVITILVLLGTLTLIPKRSLSNEDIMRKYYKVYEAPANQRSAQSNADADFSLALEYYNTHDYNRAAELFSKVIEKKPNDMQSVLLKGVSSFEEKRYPEAKLSFGKVIDDNNNLFIDQARWYLALCYVNTNENDKAKKLFIIISKEGGIYQDDANVIIKRMK